MLSAGFLDLPDADGRLRALASAVASPLSPDDAVRVAARRGGSIARETIASGSAPGDVLALLASDPDRRVRTAVAANRAAPATVLSQLAVDSSPLVRRRVEQNAAAPECARVLAALSLPTLLTRAQ